MKKKIISLCLCIVICLFFALPCFAVNVPYASITEDSSQAKILIELMLNDPDFEIFSEWFCYRASETEYVIYFNVSDYMSNAMLIRYYAVSSGYNSQWYTDRQLINQSDVIRPNTNGYLYVGNRISNYCLGSYLYRDYVLHIILKNSIILITLCSVFFVFRIKRRVSL